MRRKPPSQSEKEAFGGTEADHRERSLPVGRQFFSEEGTSHREDIHNEKGAS